MKKIGLRERQLISLDILKYFHSLCMKYGLKYSLDYGTLIGAVRHKGFIPWDDDIDVIMPRPDYNKFLEITKHQDGGKYRVLHIDRMPNYPYVTARIDDNRTILFRENQISTVDMGVFIDVFPYDAIPSNGVIRKAFFFILKSLDSCRTISCQLKFTVSKNIIKTLIKGIIYWPIKALGYKRIILIMDYIIKRVNYDKAEKVTNLTSINIEKNIFKKQEVLNEYFMQFEDAEFLAFKDYDKILRQIYGDYMILPPLDQRKPYHGKVYWKDEYNVCDFDK